MTARTGCRYVYMCGSCVVVLRTKQVVLYAYHPMDMLKINTLIFLFCCIFDLFGKIVFASQSLQNKRRSRGIQPYLEK
jgi:hypothetical protein